MKPLVSILIPAYNAEKWIEATIRSALDQTWPSKEIIVVDDGSSDSTRDLARRFESRAVNVLSQENRGACHARNRAFAEAQGDFLQWLDADDLLAPDKISHQLSDSDCSRDTRVLNSSAWGRFYFNHRRARLRPDPLWQDLSPVDWLVTSFNSRSFMHPSAWLVSRRLTLLAGPWDERLVRNQDGEYFSRVVAQSEFVKFHRQAISYYRVGNLGTVHRNRSTEAMESCLLSYHFIIDRLLALETSDVTKRASVHLLQCFINEFGPPAAIFQTVQERARELGGSVTSPAETWRFTLARRVLGRRSAVFLKRARDEIQRVQSRNWDRFLLMLQRLQ